MDPLVAAGLAGAAVPGLLALAIAIVVAVRQRRMRAAQTVLIGDGEARPLVDAQADLHRRVGELQTALEDLRALVDRQAEFTARELSTVLRFQGLVRYDAYRDMGGGQSWSIALLDEHATGTVISCLHARDHARVYVKEVVRGESAQRLSPEEQRAIGIATAAEGRRAA
ncbi:MAG TPA: DUF4446 family protein [Miltoncostaeaceae bacterium]|nr:DUF4446 family protein [Miltoncostaeaceae bacterium]